MKITDQQLEQQIWDRLRQVMDPELNINLVDLGLIYKVEVKWSESSSEGREKSSKKQLKQYNASQTEFPHIFIQMTLTTPGCPLAAMFDPMIRESLLGLRCVDDGEADEGDDGDGYTIDIEKDVDIELTFDPPWVMDMMSEEAKAELGMD